jgi:hypothetical protein
MYLYFTELPEPPNTSAQRHPDSIITGVPTTVPSNSEDPSSSKNPQQNIQVRGVEVGIVLLVLVVWIAAIALFFNRWGKIRMLLPYQPDYKEQLKVPGSGACTVSAGGPCPGQQHGSSQGCPQVSTTRLSHQTGSSDASIHGCHEREIVAILIFVLQNYCTCIVYSTGLRICIKE